MNGWHNVNAKEPCPVCGKTDWCSVSDDGAVSVCRRTPSDHPTKSGNGWIHRLREVGEMSGSGSGRNSTLPLTTPTYTVDVDAYFRALPTGHEQVRLARRLMRELTLPSDLILAMDVRWDAQAKAAAFPMRNAAGVVTGIRYRSLTTGKKWSFKGGKDGLFYIPEFFSALDHELVICEGPTDMLAAAACGIVNIVGRSSCGTGAALLREMAHLMKAECVTIIADNDEEKTRPDGSTFRPGQDGAKALAKQLNLAYRIMYPPAKDAHLVALEKRRGITNPNPLIKDLRDWYATAGMTEAWFKTVRSGAQWRVGGINA